MIESWINGRVVQDIFTELGAGFLAVERKAGDAIHAFSEEMVAQKKKLAKIVLDMNMKMFLRDNYVHGDLHGGNLVKQRSSPPRAHPRFPFSLCLVKAFIAPFRPRSHVS